MGKVSLLADTRKALKAEGKKSTEVLWVGSKDGKYSVSWKDFVKLAGKVKYSSPGQYECFPEDHVVQDLVIVGDGWWLERGDGSFADDTGWFLREHPTVAGKEPIPFKVLSADRPKGCDFWPDGYLFADIEEANT